MPLNDPVPSTADDVVERNFQDFDRFVVGTANSFVNRLGVDTLTITGAIKQFSSSTGWFIVGTFADGFTFTAYNQVGRDASGELWSYNGALPFTVTAGTVPSEPTYTNRGDAALRTDLQNGTADISGVTADEASKYVTAKGSSQRLVQKLKFGKDANIISLSDSTGDATNEWVYQTAVLLANAYPTHTVRYRLWDNGLANYGGVTTIQTGSTSAILTVWNAAISGSIATRFVGSDLEAAVRPGVIGGDPDLVFINYGHNGGNVLERQYSMHSTLIAEIARLCPITPVIIIGQNPVTTDDSMTEKVNAFKEIAEDTGCGFIDVHSYFLDKLQPLADFYNDTVHPNAAGSLKWAELVFSALQYSLKGKGGINRSKFSAHIKTMDTFEQIEKETAVLTNATVEKDLVEFESKGQSLKLTGNGGANPQFVITVIDSNDIKKYRGRYVNVNARIRVPAGSTLLTGRIALFDGTTTITSTNGGPFGNDFYSQVLSMKVGNAATYVRLYFYIDNASPTEFLNIDRVTVGDGLSPFEGRSIVDLDLESMTLFGSNSSGIASARNAATDGALMQVLSSASPVDANPATEYTFSWSANGIRVKQSADAFDRLFTDKDGSLYFGYGSVAAAVRLQSTGAGLLRLIGASLYNQDNDTHDLGISGKAWRVTYTNEIRLANSTVKLLSGAGTPEGSVTANIGSLYTRTDGGAGTTLYVKEAGTGNTGWVAK